MNRASARRGLGLRETGTVVLVIGGSQGSAAINLAVAGALDSLFQKENLQILWQTGTAQFSRYSYLADLYPSLKVVPFLDRMDWAYASADLAISRAGALALAELQATGTPSILVPFPGAAADHQTRNARSLVASGAAVLIPQSELSSRRLASDVQGLLENSARRARMAAAARHGARLDAAAIIADHILALAA